VTAERCRKRRKGKNRRSMDFWKFLTRRTSRFFSRRHTPANRQKAEPSLTSSSSTPPSASAFLRGMRPRKEEKRAPSQKGGERNRETREEKERKGENEKKGFEGSGLLTPTTRSCKGREGTATDAATANDDDDTDATDDGADPDDDDRD
jgi:hypothetical protein